MRSFPCTSCGECCKNVHLSELTAYLDRGDGTCHHFDSIKNLCTIYKDRPLVCRVEDYYYQYLSNIYEWEEFIQLNLNICRTLQTQSESVVKFY